MVKENENGVNSFQYRRPVNRTKWQKVSNAIYDPDAGEFCGRTAKSWGQLLIFYTIFYIILAALFAICMQGLLATIDLDKPKWTLDDSLIGTNPGLGFRPISERTEEGSLIWYDPKNETNVKKWVDRIDDFLAPYNTSQLGGNYVNCDFDKFPEEGKVCNVDVEHGFGPCSKSNQYGYNSPSPCVFLKLNKIFGWQPTYFNTPVPEMPKELQEFISNTPANATDMIWISCNGDGPPDKESVNTFKYFPQRGFASYYYPYKNYPNYLSPLVAIRIMNPKENVIVSIECRAWAKNIKYHGGNLNREGSIHFEIMIDNIEKKMNSTEKPL